MVVRLHARKRRLSSITYNIGRGGYSILAMETTDTVRVAGTSCGHCVGAVEAAIVAIPGVTAVAVDLASGRVDITSGSPLDAEVVRAAVEAAGYEVIS